MAENVDGVLSAINEALGGEDKQPKTPNENETNPFSALFSLIQSFIRSMAPSRIRVLGTVDPPDGASAVESLIYQCETIKIDDIFTEYWQDVLRYLWQPIILAVGIACLGIFFKIVADYLLSSAPDRENDTSRQLCKMAIRKS